jgi:hypothetical protein
MANETHRNKSQVPDKKVGEIAVAYVKGTFEINPHADYTEQARQMLLLSLYFQKGFEFADSYHRVCQMVREDLIKTKSEREIEWAIKEQTESILKQILDNYLPPKHS